MTLYGGIEAGDTKFVCAVGTQPGDVRAIRRIPTTSPEVTLMAASDFFLRYPEPPLVVGIGSFGPIDTRPNSPTYGYITSTPKQRWVHTPIVAAVHRSLGVPVAFEH